MDIETDQDLAQFLGCPVENLTEPTHLEYWFKQVTPLCDKSLWDLFKSKLSPYAPSATEATWFPLSEPMMCTLFDGIASQTEAIHQFKEALNQVLSLKRIFVYNKNLRLGDIYFGDKNDPLIQSFYDKAYLEDPQRENQMHILCRPPAIHKICCSLKDEQAVGRFFDYRGTLKSAILLHQEHLLKIKEQNQEDRIQSIDCNLVTIKDELKQVRNELTNLSASVALQYKMLMEIAKPSLEWFIETKQPAFLVLLNEKEYKKTKTLNYKVHFKHVVTEANLRKCQWVPIYVGPPIHLEDQRKKWTYWLNNKLKTECADEHPMDSLGAKSEISPIDLVGQMHLVAIELLQTHLT